MVITSLGWVRNPAAWYPLLVPKNILCLVYWPGRPQQVAQSQVQQVAPGLGDNVPTFVIERQGFIQGGVHFIFYDEYRSQIALYSSWFSTCLHTILDTTEFLPFSPENNYNILTIPPKPTSKKRLIFSNLPKKSAKSPLFFDCFMGREPAGLRFLGFYGLILVEEVQILVENCH